MAKKDKPAAGRADAQRMSDAQETAQAPVAETHISHTDGLLSLSSFTRQATDLVGASESDRERQMTLLKDSLGNPQNSFNGAHMESFRGYAQKLYEGLESYLEYIKPKVSEPAVEGEDEPEEPEEKKEVSFRAADIAERIRAIGESVQPVYDELMVACDGKADDDTIMRFGDSWQNLSAALDDFVASEVETNIKKSLEIALVAHDEEALAAAINDAKENNLGNTEEVERAVASLSSIQHRKKLQRLGEEMESLFENKDRDVDKIMETLITGHNMAMDTSPQFVKLGKWLQEVIRLKLVDAIKGNNFEGMMELMEVVESFGKDWFKWGVTEEFEEVYQQLERHLKTSEAKDIEQRLAETSASVSHQLQVVPVKDDTWTKDRKPVAMIGENLDKRGLSDLVTAFLETADDLKSSSQFPRMEMTQSASVIPIRQTRNGRSFEVLVGQTFVQNIATSTPEIVRLNQFPGELVFPTAASGGSGKEDEDEVRDQVTQQIEKEFMVRVPKTGIKTYLYQKKGSLLPSRLPKEGEYGYFKPKMPSAPRTGDTDLEARRAELAHLVGVSRHVVTDFEVHQWLARRARRRAFLVQKVFVLLRSLSTRQCVAMEEKIRQFPDYPTPQVFTDLETELKTMIPDEMEAMKPVFAELRDLCERSEEDKKIAEMEERRRAREKAKSDVATPAAATTESAVDGLEGQEANETEEKLATPANESTGREEDEVINVDSAVPDNVDDGGIDANDNQEPSGSVQDAPAAAPANVSPTDISEATSKGGLPSRVDRSNNAAKQPPPQSTSKATKPYAPERKAVEQTFMQKFGSWFMRLIRPTYKPSDESGYAHNIDTDEAGQNRVVDTTKQWYTGTRHYVLFCRLLEKFGNAFGTFSPKEREFKYKAALAYMGTERCFSPEYIRKNPQAGVLAKFIHALLKNLRDLDVGEEDPSLQSVRRSFWAVRRFLNEFCDEQEVDSKAREPLMSALHKRQEAVEEDVCYRIANESCKTLHYETIVAALQYAKKECPRFVILENVREAVHESLKLQIHRGVQEGAYQSALDAVKVGETKWHFMDLEGFLLDCREAKNENVVKDWFTARTWNDIQAATVSCDNSEDDPLGTEVYEVVQDYTAEHPSELSVTRGEILVYLGWKAHGDTRTRKYLLCQKRQVPNPQGYVPGWMLQKLDHEDAKSRNILIDSRPLGEGLKLLGDNALAAARARVRRAQAESANPLMSKFLDDGKSIRPLQSHHEEADEMDSRKVDPEAAAMWDVVQEVGAMPAAHPTFMLRKENKVGAKRMRIHSTYLAFLADNPCLDIDVDRVNRKLDTRLERVKQLMVKPEPKPKPEKVPTPPASVRGEGEATAAAAEEMSGGDGDQDAPPLQERKVSSAPEAQNQITGGTRAGRNAKQAAGRNARPQKGGKSGRPQSKSPPRGRGGKAKDAPRAKSKSKSPPRKPQPPRSKAKGGLGGRAGRVQKQAQAAEGGGNEDAPVAVEPEVNVAAPRPVSAPDAPAHEPPVKEPVAVEEEEEDLRSEWEKLTEDARHEVMPRLRRVMWMPVEEFLKKEHGFINGFQYNEFQKYGVSVRNIPHMLYSMVRHVKESFKDLRDLHAFLTQRDLHVFGYDSDTIGLRKVQEELDLLQWKRSELMKFQKLFSSEIASTDRNIRYYDMKRSRLEQQQRRINRVQKRLPPPLREFNNPSDLEERRQKFKEESQSMRKVVDTMQPATDIAHVDRPETGRLFMEIVETAGMNEEKRLPLFVKVLVEDKVIKTRKIDPEPPVSMHNKENTTKTPAVVVSTKKIPFWEALEDSAPAPVRAETNEETNRAIVPAPTKATSDESNGNRHVFEVPIEVELNTPSPVMTVEVYDYDVLRNHEFRDLLMARFTYPLAMLKDEKAVDEWWLPDYGVENWQDGEGEWLPRPLSNWYKPPQRSSMRVRMKMLCGRIQIEDCDRHEDKRVCAHFKGDRTRRRLHDVPSAVMNDFKPRGSYTGMKNHRLEWAPQHAYSRTSSFQGTEVMRLQAAQEVAGQGREVSFGGALDPEGSQTQSQSARGSAVASQNGQGANEPTQQESQEDVGELPQPEPVVPVVKGRPGRGRPAKPAKAKPKRGRK